MEQHLKSLERGLRNFIVIGEAIAAGTHVVVDAQSLKEVLVNVTDDEGDNLSTWQSTELSASVYDLSVCLADSQKEQ